MSLAGEAINYTVPFQKQKDLEKILGRAEVLWR